MSKPRKSKRRPKYTQAERTVIQRFLRHCYSWVVTTQARVEAGQPVQGNKWGQRNLRYLDSYQSALRHQAYLAGVSLEAGVTDADTDQPESGGGAARGGSDAG